jgi:hypothetical protein
MDKTPAATRDFLSFPGCTACLHKPCDGLRFGRVYAGKFFFVHKRHRGYGTADCPFAPVSFDELRPVLESAPLLDVIAAVEDALSQLSPDEQNAFSLSDFVASYDDAAGRIRFLESLWDNDSVAAVRVPQVISDTRMAQWLFANEALARQFDKPT